MSTVMSRLDGPETTIEKRRPMRDEELLRTRARLIYAHRLNGLSSAEVGKIFRLSRQFINRILKAMPESEKRKVRRAASHGTPFDLE